MGSAVLFILRFIQLGLELIRVQVVLFDLVRDCFVLSKQKLYVCMVVCISWLHSCLCVYM